MEGEAGKGEGDGEGGKAKPHMLIFNRSFNFFELIAR